MDDIKSFVKWVGTDTVIYFLITSWATSVYNCFGFWTGIVGYLSSMFALFIESYYEGTRRAYIRLIYAFFGGAFSCLMWLWGDYLLNI